MSVKLMLMWVSLLGASVLGAGCVGGTSSTLTGPSTVPQAAPPASPQPQFFRYVVLALADGIRPSSAWGLAYGSNLQGTRNAALERCGSACGTSLECNPPLADAQRAYAALAMSEWSSTFPIGRATSLACMGESVAEVERRALLFCNPHPRTGACRIYWSGYLR
jgi:hypothetical protein